MIHKTLHFYARFFTVIALMQSSCMIRAPFAEKMDVADDTAAAAGTDAPARIRTPKAFDQRVHQTNPVVKAEMLSNPTPTAAIEEPFSSNPDTQLVTVKDTAGETKEPFNPQKSSKVKKTIRTILQKFMTNNIPEDGFNITQATKQKYADLKQKLGKHIKRLVIWFLVLQNVMLANKNILKQLLLILVLVLCMPLIIALSWLRKLLKNQHMNILP